MRVTFLTPRLPPAVCGLADHTQLLAEALARHGIAVGFISREPGEPGSDRLPGQVDHWSKGSAALANILRRQSPDWLWVQLSGYGYSRWGAPFALARTLAGVRRRLPKLRIAVCVHETHCESSQLGIKGPVLSRWQRATYRAVCGQGDAVFPSIPLWERRVIEDYGVSPDRVCLLPIGSNIPVPTLTPEQRRVARLQMGWAPEEVVAVSFGSYQSQVFALQRFSRLLRRGFEERALGRLVCLGGQGTVVPQELSRQATGLSAVGTVRVLGPRPASAVGEVLACCDVGLAPTPRIMVGKSGAFMALAAAGLAVVVYDGLIVSESCDAWPIFSESQWRWEDARSKQVKATAARLRQRYQQFCDWPVLAHQVLVRLHELEDGVSPPRVLSHVP